MEAPMRGRQKTEGAPSSIPRVLEKGRGVKRIKPSPGLSDTDALKTKTTAKTTACPSPDGYAETKWQRHAEVERRPPRYHHSGRPFRRPSCPTRLKRTTNQRALRRRESRLKKMRGRSTGAKTTGKPNQLEEGKINRCGGTSHDK